MCPRFVREFVHHANMWNRETALEQVHVQMPPKKKAGGA
jgi:hypothetical protein